MAGNSAMQASVFLPEIQHFKIIKIGISKLGYE